MSDTREVITTFSAKDGLTPVLTNMEGSGKSLISTFSSVKGVVLGAVAALGVGTIVNSIIDIGSQAEQTKLVLGGMFAAFGYAPDIDSGMGMALGVMQQIESSAAALPGEASDYITVFTAGFAQIESHARASLGGLRTELESITGTALETPMQQMAAFSNTMTAIGSTFGIDAEQIGRDMNLMLSGRAGVGSRTFSSMLPYMRLVEGQANLTAISFNHMTDPQRARILVGAMKSLGPMLQRASGTWDAMAGSMSTTIMQITRGGTSEIFDRMKVVMGDVNTLLTTFQDKLVGVLALVSHGLVAGFNALYKNISRFTQSPMFDGILSMADRAGDMVLRVVNDPGAAGNIAAVAGAAALGPEGVVLAGVITTLASNVEMQSSLMASSNTVFKELTDTAPVAVSALGAFSQASGGFTAGLMVGVYQGIATLSTGLREFITPLLTVATDIYTSIKPAITLLGTALGELFAAATTVLRPAMTLFGAIIREVWNVVGGPFKTIINAVITGLRTFINGLAWVVRAVGGTMQVLADDMAAVPAERPGWQEAPQGVLTAAAQAAVAAAQAEARRPAAATPAARGGHNTNNDFRYSRFDITQKFAEGFDPDRIAVGFVSDLERMANARLTSGFSPLFTS